MSPTNTDNNKFRAIEYILLLLVTLKLTSYFSWSENVMITRIIKFACKGFTSISILYIYRTVSVKYAIQKQISPPIPFLFYLLYLVLGAFSFLWSSAFDVSLQQWIMVVDALFFSWFLVSVLLLLAEVKNESLYRLIARVIYVPIFLHIMIFMVGHIIEPSSFYRATRAGEEQRLGGWIMNPNELGMLCSLGLIAVLYTALQNKTFFKYILIFAVLFYALIITGSRSSLIGFLLVVFILFQSRASTFFRVAIVVVMIIAAPIVFEKLILKSGNLDEVLSMTGRLPFWTALINEGLPKEPILGYGFMRISYTEYFSSLHTYAGKMTHNTFLQVLLNLGIVGFTVVLIQVFSTFYSILKSQKVFLFFLTIPLMINSFTEFGVFGESNFGIFYYQMIILLLTISQKYNMLIPKNGYNIQNQLKYYNPFFAET